MFASDPEEALKVRDAAFQQYEAADFDVESDMTKMLTEMSYSYLMKKVSDPQLRSKLLPDYPVGCKRPLQSKTGFRYSIYRTSHWRPLRLLPSPNRGYAPRTVSSTGPTP